MLATLSFLAALCRSVVAQLLEELMYVYMYACMHACMCCRYGGWMSYPRGILVEL